MFWKFVAVLATLCVLSVRAAEKEDSKKITCLQSPEITNKAIEVDKCYREMISAKLNTSTVGCNNFNDFNRTFINFMYHTVQKCYNKTLGNLTQSQNTFLTIVKHFMEDSNLKEHLEGLKWLVEDKKDKTKACHLEYELPSLNGTTDIARIWFRRGILKYKDLNCQRSERAKECTLKVVENSGKSSLKTVVTDIYDISLKNCQKKINSVKPSSANSVGYSCSLLIPTVYAITKMYNEM